MGMPLRSFSQAEYNRVLDEHSARLKGLGQTECENILIANGASRSRAKNGAYVYLHHDGNPSGVMRGTREQYTKLLDEFHAVKKESQACIRHLESMGFSYGQSKTAVYNYRITKGLIGK
jgi:hypothetical protein